MLKKISGFTITEILTVVSIIAILAGILLTGNIKGSIEHARDSKRKQDLNKMVRILDDYNNDYQRYPLSNSGIISGSAWGTSFGSYASQLPADPLSPSREYYYLSNPSGIFFVIYAKLENTADPDIITVGCSIGCGPNRSYNYVVHSSNIVMLAGLPSTDISGGGYEGEEGGGGGGGEGSPSNTPGPSATLGPSPTQGPTSTPAPPPGSGCDFGQCGYCTLCGGTGGIDCGYQYMCWYNAYWPGSGWDCRCSRQCGASADCPYP